MPNPKKILVTGGAGFIGSCVIRNLIEYTPHSVVNIDKLTYAGNLESISNVENSSRYTFEKVDICNTEELNSIFERHKPDLIMHLAAESHVDRSIDNADEFIMTNIFGTYSLLKVSKRYWNALDNLKMTEFRFHHISTDEVFGDLKESNDMFKETTAYSPSSPYSASKASSDHLVRAWGRTFGLPIIITNCSNNYGPFQFPEKLIPLTIINALKGKRLPVYGKGLQIRDWLYVNDHANALIRVLFEGEIGETYNIGGNVQMTNIEVVKMICNLLDELEPNHPNGINKYEDLIEFVDDRPGHDQRYAIDTSKINSQLSWLPEESFETGIRKTVEWYLNNEAWWQRVLDGSYKFQRLGLG